MLKPATRSDAHVALPVALARTVAADPSGVLLPAVAAVASWHVLAALRDATVAHLTPSLVTDGAFLTVVPSGWALTLRAVAAVLATLVTVMAVGVTALRVTAVVLGRDPSTGDLVRAVLRRRGQVLLWTLVLVTGQALAVLTASGPTPVSVLGAALALAVPLLSSSLFLVLPVALARGLGLRAAVRRSVLLLDAGPGRREVVGVARTAALVTGVSLLALGWGATVGRPSLGPAVQLALGAGAAVTLALVVAALAAVQVRATGRIEVLTERGVWTGLPADAPSGGGRRATPLAALAASALLLAPLATPALAAWNPTSAVEVQVDASEGAFGVPVPAADGRMVLVDGGSGTVQVCGAGGCAPADRGAGTGSAWSGVTAAVARPAGQGGVLVLAESPGNPYPPALALATCGSPACDLYDMAPGGIVLDAIPWGPSSRLGHVVQPGLEHRDQVALGAGPGTVAAVVPRDEGRLDGTVRRVVDLVRCTDAACEDRDTIPLGPLGAGVTDVAVADDGTVVALLVSETFDTLSVVSLARDSVLPRTVLVTDAGGARPGTYETAELALTAEGAPVVLHREDERRPLRLTTCGDVACTAVSTTELDLPAEASGSPALAVDSAGRAVVATGGGGVRVTACTDAACTDSTSRVVWEHWPVSGGWARSPGYLALDEADRPVLAVTGSDDVSAWSGGYRTGRTYVLRCAEARCGL